jgi:Phosphate-selective porin O and P
MRLTLIQAWASVCVVALALSAPAPALAQPPNPQPLPASSPQPIPATSPQSLPAPPLTYGFYYKEVPKDGRIYVFNIPDEAARFELTGEMGRALTRPGSGPNGETVVGDSERALQLFYFKHGLSEPVADPVAPIQRVEWRDGKTRITTDLAYLEISNRIQSRYTHEFPDNTVTLPGTADAGDSRGSFRIRRAKLKLEGWLWKPPGAAPGPVTQPQITYEVQLNWPAVTGTNPGAMLEDANIGIDPTGRGTFRVLFGQFKVPFGRQELTSSGNQSLVDRSLVSNEYARGRDTGVAVQGATRNNKLEYRFGVFNGNGLTRTTNDNATVQINGRVMWQPNGFTPLAQRAWVSGPLYSEADFESTTTPIYAVALNYEHNDFHRTTTGNDLKADVVGIDGVYKFKGVFATAEYYLRRRTPETGGKFRADGGFGQVGVMLNSYRTWEAAFRYGSRDANEKIGNDTIKEYRAGLNYYYRRHSLKFQIDGGLVETGLAAAGGKRKDAEVRTQAQFIF